MMRNDRTIVLSSDRPPHELSGLDGGLRSRLNSGLVATIAPPELPARRQILREKAAGGGVHVPEECLEMLAVRPVRSVRDMLGGLNQVVARASLLRKSVTADLVAEALNAVSVPGPTRTLAEIIDLHKGRVAWKGIGESNVITSRLTKLDFGLVQHNFTQPDLGDYSDQLVSYVANGIVDEIAGPAAQARE